ncbi:MAG: S8 family serine peptidase [Bacteroidetes bacterium]|jgi:hypothetical protein|nr:S8 family serine peptidase [Bacteroidota bacterium]
MKNSFILIRFIGLFLFLFSIQLQAQENVARIHDEIIVQLDEGVSPTIPSGQYELLSASLNVYKLSFTTRNAAEKYYEAERMKEYNRAIHFNHYVSFRDTIPNDPQFDLQYSFQDLLEGGTRDVQAADAWDITRGGVTALGDTIVIAVIDDGVDINHIDLDQNMYVNRSEVEGTGLDNDANGYVDDKFGWNVRDDNGQVISADHGTGVAGVIGARGNNGALITGANWVTKILPVTMGEDATVAEVIKAYQYVLDQRRLYNQTDGEKGAYVVASNNSFGLEGFTVESAPYWCEFFDTLGQEGIMTISSAPNRVFDIDEVGDLPTVCPSPYLITVSATDFNLEWNASGISSEHVDVTSFGGGIFTLGQGNSTQFGDLSSSMAAAMASGLTGLMYSVPCPDFAERVQSDLTLVYEPVRNAIFSGLTPQPFLENKTAEGGITNFFETLRGLMEPCDTCIAPSEVVFTSVISNDDSTFLIRPTLQSDSLIWLQRPAGARMWDTLAAPLIDSLFLDMSPECEDLQYAFIPICDSVPGRRSKIFTSKFKNCSACEIQYCTPESSSFENIWIESVSFRDDEIYTGNDLGYADYSNLVFSTYETAEEEQWLEIRFKKDLIFDTLSFAAWLDIDHNGRFDPLEKVGTLVTSNTSSDTLQLNLPFTAIGGLTTLRLGMIPKSNEVSRLQPCTAIPLEATYEDFCVDLIVNDPLCPTIDSLVVVEKESNTIKLSVQPELRPRDEGVNIRYRKEGEEDWTQETKNGETFRLEELEGNCTTYEVEIRRLCDFDTSAYTQFTVETFCPTSAPSPDISGLTIFPNPFDRYIIIDKNSEAIGMFSLRLYNQQGQIVDEQKSISSSSSYRFEVNPNLPPGLYYIQIWTKDGTAQRKLIRFRGE